MTHPGIGDDGFRHLHTQTQSEAVKRLCDGVTLTNLEDHETSPPCLSCRQAERALKQGAK
jgi:hypothetical protein